MPKYHVGANGPAVCKATKIACRFGAHGTEIEMLREWETSQAKANTDYMASLSKESEKSLDDKAPKVLANPEAYSVGELVTYTNEELSVASKLGPLTATKLSSAKAKKDKDFWVKSISDVSAYIFEDKSFGIFKRVKNDEANAPVLARFGTTTLGASINEVNAYRMAKLLGEGFKGLVPETAFRKVKSSIGSIQLGVKEDHTASKDIHSESQLQEDYRRAVIFDYVIGSLDRHGSNVLYGVENVDGVKRNRLKLIDNAFSFPEDKPSNSSSFFLNESIFANNDGTEVVYNYSTRSNIKTYKLSDETLTDSEKAALRKARTGVEKWIEEGTIAHSRGSGVLARIDRLLVSGKLQRLSDYEPEDTPLPELD